MGGKDRRPDCVFHAVEGLEAELAVVAAGALLSIPGAIYAVVKTAFQAITGRPAKGRVWTVLDVVAEVLPNLPGAINRAVRGAGLGDELLAGALAFAEVRGQLEVRVTHSRPAIDWPATAAATPRTTLTTRLASAGRIWRSSVSRWVSSIQVEKVV